MPNWRWSTRSMASLSQTTEDDRLMGRLLALMLCLKCSRRLEVGAKCWWMGAYGAALISSRLWHWEHAPYWLVVLSCGDWPYRDRMACKVYWKSCGTSLNLPWHSLVILWPGIFPAR